MPTSFPYLRTIPETARESGRSEREISRTATGQPAAISLIKTGRIPSVERVRRLCDALDLEFYIGPRRQRPPSVPREEVRQVHETRAPPRQVRETRAPRIEFLGLPPVLGDLAGKDASAIDASAYITLMRIKLFGNGESGPVNLATQYVEIQAIGIHGAENRVAFRRDWLTRHGIDPNQSVVLGVSGESMAPTVPDGSSVLVDCSRHTHPENGIFVVLTGANLALKRIYKDHGGRWVLTGDHPDWPDEPWPEYAGIFGEVKWVATLLA